MLPSLPSDDLSNPLFGDTEGSSDTRPSFTRFVARDNFSITFGFFGHQVILGFGRARGVVEHLEYVKGRQPDVEASCELEPPCMIRTGQTHWPDLEEWDTLETQVNAGQPGQFCKPLSLKALP